MSLSTNIELEQICREKGIPLVGIYSKDLLREIKPVSGCYIINLADVDEPGTHWTAFVLDKKAAYYYDSFGVGPPVDVMNFIRKFTKHVYINEKHIQNVNSGWCGFWVLSFLYHMTFTKLPKLKAFKQFIAQWKDAGK